MTQEQKHKIAYDLSIEYMKVRGLLKEVDDRIPEIVNRFSDIYESFYNSIDNSKLNDLM